MTDRKFKDLKVKVDKIIDKWREPLGLNGHRLRIKHLREYHRERYTVAQVFPLWQYKHHTVEIFMPSIAECEDDSELEEDILHELVHILIAPSSGNEVPQSDAQRQMNEYATQSITHALLGAYELGKGKKNAKV